MLPEKLATKDTASFIYTVINRKNNVNMIRLLLEMFKNNVL